MAVEATKQSDLSENGTLIETLWEAIDHCNLDKIPGLVRKVIETGAWQKRVHRGRVFEHKRFVDFIVTKPLAGCGWPPDKVANLIKDDPEVLTMWQQAVVGKVGRPSTKTSDNITIKSHRGTSRADTLRRLKREHPTIHAAVVAGELSANAGAIKAGFRKKPRKHCPSCGHEW